MIVNGNISAIELAAYQGHSLNVEDKYGAAAGVDKLTQIATDVVQQLDMKYGTKIQICRPSACLEDGSVTLYLVFNETIDPAEVKKIGGFVCDLFRSHR